MANILDTLRERGFLKQITFEDELYQLLDTRKVPFYVGFDPTADSLHVGHYIPIIAMKHMQEAGHTPIALMGGGTAMVGDPSGRTDMRQMLTKETIRENVAKIQKQMSRFLDFDPARANAARIVNNADWLLQLNYVDFLRDIGVHFSVNRMLAADCYKNRMEKGLSFLEFNYMLMQSYDFLVLNQKYGCVLQMGGDDQWSNMLNGADLIRRVERKPAFACTFSLLLNSQGQKMGKTVGGALWLDAEKVSPYEFYQYWRNVDDRDVERCLSLLTLVPMDEVRRLSSLPDSGINEAKRVLAYEITKLVHGRDEAEKAREAAEALFAGSGDMDLIPTTTLTREAFLQGNRVIELLVASGLCKSNGEGRRLIRQDAIRVDNEIVRDEEARVDPDTLADGSVLLQKGKKGFHRFLLEG